ncbi:MAG: hypothetical protein ACK5GU_00095 [Chloroflexota bacterium]|jgi:hypothetical protein
MTKGPIDRKVLQRVRSESEQNERLLGRVITTALSTCGTLVGWMVLSQAAAATTVEVNTVDVGNDVGVVDGVAMSTDTMPNPTIAPVQIDFAPIPTLSTLPDLLPVPTLMPYVAQPISADAAPAPAQNESAPVVAAAPADAGVAVVQAPVSDMPVLRVVAQPTPPVIKVVPKPAAPANPRPAAGGNSGGSN